MFPLKIWSKISLLFFPLNGGFPHNRIYVIIPKDQISHE